jgi:hypothetical protein
VLWHLIIDHPGEEDKPIKSMGPLKWGDGSAIMSGAAKACLFWVKLDMLRKIFLSEAEM